MINNKEVLVLYTYTSNDLDKYSLLDHTHSNYVTSSEVSEIVNENISNGTIEVSGSMIRNITRGTSSGNGDVTIDCSITDTSKVIVLLDADITYEQYDGSSSDFSAAAGAVYLKSISTSKIIVCAHGLAETGGSGNKIDVNGSITFSYQIIEFM